MWRMQTAAEAEAKQAGIRAKHLQGQLAEQQRALASNQKEAGQLQRELDKQVSKAQACQRRYAPLLQPTLVVRKHHRLVFMLVESMQQASNVVQRPEGMDMATYT